jgi:membrane-anchored glycerophosphoryl diester phosphodiesterase (GDPDase)
MGNIIYPPSRPQSVGEVLDSAFRIYSTTLLKCLPYSFASVIVGQLLSLYDVLHRPAATAAALPAAAVHPAHGLTWGVLALLVTVASMMFANAVFLRQYALSTGRAPSMTGELSRSLRRVPGVLLMGILIALALLATMIPVVLVLAATGAFAAITHPAGLSGSQVWSMLAVVLVVATAASWVIIKWVCAMPVYLLTDRGPIDSMSHSWRLTAGNFWRLSIIYTVGVILLIVFYLLASIVGGMVALWLGRGDVVLWVAVSTAVVALLAALFTPFYHALVLAVFGDLSVRREGADLALRISATAIQ